MKLLLILMSAPLAFGQSAGVVESVFSNREFDLTADPATPHWKAVKPVIAALDRWGKPVPGHRTGIRTRWTNENLYVIYTCPYQKLNLRPNPSAAKETNRLWLNDVAEIFIGSDPQKIHLYKEYQVSPQGEWVDLDIDKLEPNAEGGWFWNSGMQVKARIDEAKKIWYGEFRIPIRSFDERPVKAGNEVRINFYRIQGPEPRVLVNWQPVKAPSFHTPEAFGRLVFKK